MDKIIVFCAQYLYLFVILVIVVAWLRIAKDKKAQFFAATILAGIIAFILSRVASRLYYDPRPFVSEHVKPLFAHIADNGFPSDHALLTMTLTAAAYFYNKKAAAVMLVLSIIIGVARVLAKVHSPLDIGSGWVFGITGSIAGYCLVKWYFKHHKRNEQPTKTS